MNWKAVLFSSALLSVGTLAQASDYGCKVLMCLANPNGPKAVKECEPPIDRLWYDLARSNDFPSCDMAQGPNGRSYAQLGTSYYDACPSGTTALSNGASAIQGLPAAAPNQLIYQQSVYVGIGSGDSLAPDNSEFARPMPAKTCVGSLLGNILVEVGSGGETGYTTVNTNVYDRVVLMDPIGNPRLIDVFVDNQLYRRVRW